MQTTEKRQNPESQANGHYVPTSDEVVAKILQFESDPATQAIGDPEHLFRLMKQVLENRRGRFALHFVVYDGAPQRKQIVRRLREEMPDQRPVEVQLSESDESILDKLLSAPDAPEPLFVYGIERLLPSGKELHNTLRRERSLRELQLQRERFRTLGRPLLLWMPEYVYSMIGQQAVDFWSWQSGAFFFTKIQERKVGIFDGASAGKDGFEGKLPAQSWTRGSISKWLPDWRSVLVWMGVAAFGLVLHAFAGPHIPLFQKPANRLLLSLLASLILTGLVSCLFLSYSGVARAVGRALEFDFLFGGLADIYEYFGRTPKALEYYERALGIARKTDDKRDESMYLRNIGNAHRKLGNPREVIKNYEQALAIDREIGERSWESVDLVNLGYAYGNLGEAKEAIKHYEDALKIDRETSDRKHERITLGSLGHAYRDLGETREAIKHS
ncbi:MAG: tetratricopeptide repeat protein, partial [Blastocatellia bacterium]